MANDLHEARLAKKNEFYTQYEDIQKEINSYLEYNPDTFRDKTIFLPCDDPEWSNFTKFFVENFKDLGLKKLISTSYATNSKNKQITIFDYISDFEINSKQYNADITNERGKIFVLTRKNQVKININDLNWKYLEGDGDFRSDEIKRLRDEADFVITNPPFSLFREFVAWIMESGKRFAVIGNMNAITYKEIFPLLEKNKVWLGATIHSGDREFGVPKEYPLEAAGWRIDEKGNHFIRVKGVRWFTNIEHGRRHEPLSLMTETNNIKFSKHKDVKGLGYKKYDNYDAIDIPYTDAIPCDYDGVMGVPISFLDKYCPEQFEIIGCTEAGNDLCKKFYQDLHLVKNGISEYNMKSARYAPMVFHKEMPEGAYYTASNLNGFMTKSYFRIFIKSKK